MENKNMNELRRSFLKKLAYAAPAVVVLGALTAPSQGHASDSVLKTGTVNVDGSNKNVIVDPTDPIGDFAMMEPIV